jgi:hypothetical protein
LCTDHTLPIIWCNNKKLFIFHRLAREQPPSGVTFTAVGEDIARRIIARDDRSVWYGWDKTGFIKLEEAPKPQSGERLWPREKP